MSNLGRISFLVQTARMPNPRYCIKGVPCLCKSRCGLWKLIVFGRRLFEGNQFQLTSLPPALNSHIHIYILDTFSKKLPPPLQTLCTHEEEEELLLLQVKYFGRAQSSIPFTDCYYCYHLDALSFFTHLIRPGGILLSRQDPSSLSSFAFSYGG